MRAKKAMISGREIGILKMETEGVLEYIASDRIAVSTTATHQEYSGTEDLNYMKASVVVLEGPYTHIFHFHF